MTNLAKITFEGVLSCDKISENDAPYIICSMEKPKYEPRYKFVRMEKNFDPGAFKSEVEQLPFTTVCAMET